MRWFEYMVIASRRVRFAGVPGPVRATHVGGLSNVNQGEGGKQTPKVWAVPTPVWREATSASASGWFGDGVLGDY